MGQVSWTDSFIIKNFQFLINFKRERIATELFESTILVHEYQGKHNLTQTKVM